VFLANKKLRISYIIVILFIAYTIYNLFKDTYLAMIQYYFIETMQSSGGIIRILLNVLAGVLFFIIHKKWKRYYNDYYIWKLFSLSSFFILVFAIATKATTIGDRILLYFYPLQIVVFSRAIYLLNEKYTKRIYFFLLITLYWAVLLVWLNFATHRFAWLSYDNLLLKVFQ